MSGYPQLNRQPTTPSSSFSSSPQLDRPSPFFLPCTRHSRGSSSRHISDLKKALLCIPPHTQPLPATTSPLLFCVAGATLATLASPPLQLGQEVIWGSELTASSGGQPEATSTPNSASLLLTYSTWRGTYNLTRLMCDLWTPDLRSGLPKLMGACHLLTYTCTQYKGAGKKEGALKHSIVVT